MLRRLKENGLSISKPIKHCINYMVMDIISINYLRIIENFAVFTLAYNQKMSYYEKVRIWHEAKS